MINYSAQRVGVFIDAQNLYHSARSMFKSRVNYRPLIKDLIGERLLIRAFAYVIRSKGEEEVKFFEALGELGIEIRVKDLQIFYGGEKKADWDVGISIDIVRMSEKLDAVILMSGDGDFVEVLRFLKSRGVRTEVAAFKRSTSAHLIEEADSFLDIGEQKEKFLFRLKNPRTTGMNDSRNLE